MFSSCQPPQSNRPRNYPRWLLKGKSQCLHHSGLPLGFREVVRHIASVQTSWMARIWWMWNTRCWVRSSMATTAGLGEQEGICGLGSASKHFSDQNYDWNQPSMVSSCNLWYFAILAHCCPYLRCLQRHPCHQQFFRLSLSSGLPVPALWLGKPGTKWPPAPSWIFSTEVVRDRS